MKELVMAGGTVREMDVKIDEKTGEICIGPECFQTRYDPKANVISFNINPNAESCDTEMRKAALHLLDKIMDGASTKIVSSGLKRDDFLRRKKEKK
jgi:hypothetical protein